MKRSLLLTSLVLLSACAPALNLGSNEQPLRGSSGLSQNAISYAEVTPQTSPDASVRLPGCPNASFRLGDVQALGENGPAIACERVRQVQTGAYATTGAIVLIGLIPIIYFFNLIFRAFGSI